MGTADWPPSVFCRLNSLSCKILFIAEKGLVNTYMLDSIILRANLHLTSALGKHLEYFVLYMEYTVGLHTVPAETLYSESQL
jgi:hypothetical protein